MGIQRKLVMIVVLVFLLPSTSFASGEQIKTGYDLYHGIQRINNPQTPDEISAALIATGYLNGFLDGMVVMQQTLYESVLPRKMLSEEERKKMAKELNFHRLNVPDGGLAIGQLILIYKKYAEKHPEGLNGSARICVFEALVEAYGWK